MSKKVAEKMFNELTKGQDVHHPTITAEQLTDAMLDSVSGMKGTTPEALEQLRERSAWNLAVCRRAGKRP